MSGKSKEHGQTEKKPEESESSCLLYVITAVVVIQCLTFLCVNVWQEWRLDFLKTSVSEKGQLLALLETGCDLSEQGVSLNRDSRQVPTMTNFLRDFLAVQEKSLETICVRRHDLCIPGPQGTLGDQGPPGARGDSGLSGIHGEKGAQGPQGIAGAKGDAGPKGVKGATGTNGTAGPQGTKGATGPPGTMGPRGDQGPRGDIGPQGLKGARGDQGVKGGPGPKGAVGDQGAKGDHGDQGPPGQKGEPGIRGLDGRLLHSECFCLNDFKVQGNFSDIVNVPYGAPLSLHCQFNMLHIPVTWSKDGGTLSQRVTVKGNDIDFEQVLKGDGGTYLCSGPDGVLGYVSKAVTVVVGQSSMYDCDFETTCSWTQATDDKLQWVLHQGRTPTAKTGPTHDHTLNSGPGNYMYMESSSVATGANAVLESKPLSEHHQFCLTFWYHMYGATIGTLEVRLKQPGRLGPPIWSKSGDQGDQWRMAKVDLVPQNTNYYVTLNAIRGSSFTGDIAIDDIIFLDGVCPP